MELGDESGRLDQLHHARLGSGEEHIEGLEVSIQTPLFELRQNPLGIFFVIRGPDVMGASAEPLHVLAHLVCPLALSASCRSGVAGKRSLVGPGGQGQQAADGFVPRVDVRDANQFIDYRYWPGSKTILFWNPRLFLQGVWDHNGVRQDWVIRPAFRLELRRQTGFFANYQFKHERFQGIDFYKRNFVLWMGVFAFEKVSFRLEFDGGTDINFSPATGLLPFLGRSTAVRFVNTLRPTRGLRIDNTYIFDRLTERDTGASIFNNHIARTKVNYQFTPRLSLRTILQYQATLANPALTSLVTTRRFTGEVLLTYLVHPGTVLYVGYNDILDNPDPRLFLTGAPPLPPRTRFLETGREFFVKFSYLFRF